MLAPNRLCLLLQLAASLPSIGLLACRETAGISEAPLRDAATFPVGVAVSVSRVWEDPTYEALVRHHFDSLTPESAMKMAAIHPERDAYNWVYADGLVEFARETGQRLHGHVLVWHEDLPGWVATFQGDASAWSAMLEEHITTIVTRYADAFDQWDVVNEAFEDDGTLRHTIWAEHLGEDYVAACFQWAGAADPGAKLFYNDFGLASSPQKLAAVLEMVDDLRSREPPVPIHGIGLQMHVDLEHPTIEEVAHAAGAIAGRGLLVRFSELDVALNPGGEDIDLSSALLEAQRERYREIVAFYAGLPDEVQAGITVWGVSDADSWMRLEAGRMDWPLLFDEAYQAKPAFFGFAAGLQPGDTSPAATITRSWRP